jgi:hypothetical protein
MSFTTSFRDWLGAPGTTVKALSAARPGIEVYAELREKAVSARIALKRPVSLDAIEAFENESGIRLPDDYVFFITMVGNGGIEPCRLVPIEDWDAGYWSQAKLERDLIAPCLITPELKALGNTWLGALGVEQADKKWDRDEWDPLRGSMAIAEIGCGLFFHLIVNGPHFGRVFVWGESAFAPPLFQPQRTFSDWIGHHLDAKIAGRPVHFLDGRIR